MNGSSIHILNQAHLCTYFCILVNREFIMLLINRSLKINLAKFKNISVQASEFM